MKIVAVSIVFAVCLVLTHANGRGQYMGMYYGLIGKFNRSRGTTFQFNYKSSYMTMFYTFIYNSLFNYIEIDLVITLQWNSITILESYKLL